MAALDELKRANPDGRFWLKLDGTGVKTGIQEFVKGKWNGDLDLLDGKLGDADENEKQESVKKPVRQRL